MNEQETKQVEIEWESDEAFHFPVTAHMVTNFDSEHFYVRFYQITPPVILDGQSLPDFVKAKFVTGVAIPVSHMASMVQALQGNVEKYESRTGAVLNSLERDEHGTIEQGGADDE